MRISEARKNECRENLRFLKPGDTVYCILRHVARSGMSRNIDLFVIRDSQPQMITCWAADLLGYPRAKDGSARLGGCGMDMGFAFVYELGRELFRDGFGEIPIGNLAKQRPASQEQAARWCSQGETFRGRNGDSSGWDIDGGYALKRVWM
jgi:hypothetical protein